MSADICSPKASAREQGALTFVSAGTGEAHRQAQGGQHLPKAWQTPACAEQDHTQHSGNTQGHRFIFPISTYSTQTALWERTWGISFTKNRFQLWLSLTSRVRLFWKDSAVITTMEKALQEDGVNTQLEENSDQYSWLAGTTSCPALKRSRHLSD